MNKKRRKKVANKAGFTPTIVLAIYQTRIYDTSKKTINPHATWCLFGEQHFMENLLTITKREDLRAWLQSNSEQEKECWIVASVSQKPDTILYLDAVEEALCFGWIDSTKKKDAENRVIQRLSPRSAKSSWTELNKQRVRRLERQGLMTDAGRKVLPADFYDDYVMDEIIENRLKEDADTYDNFMSFPELYRKIRTDTIVQVKKDQELFEKRLSKLCENTNKGKMFGLWNDNGRLLE